LASAEALARDFWSALCHQDTTRAASLLAEGAVFQPAGMPPASGADGVARYVAATGREIGWSLDTVALYEDMVITERIGRVVGDPAGRQRVIVSLARVREGRITSWQDFCEATPSGEPAGVSRSGARVARAPERVAAR
jgi:limonene-1,2-epoxide hydrolase